MSDTAQKVLAASVGGTTTGAPSQNGSTLKFPTDHDVVSGMWLNLMEFEYKRSTAAAAATPNATGTQISLPIPPNLSASYGAEWQSDTISHLKRFAINELEDAGFKTEKEMQGFTKDPASWLAKKSGLGISSMINSMGHLGSGMSLVKEAAGAIASDFISGGFGATLASTTGIARNPWVAQIFTGMNFRSWTFQYKFFPRNKGESDSLENIILRLKYGMHPDFLDDMNNLFKYPNMYLPFLSPNKYLFEFGFCIIKDLSVDYHADGSSPIYHSVPGDNGGTDKIPACIGLSFTLSEIEINTKKNLAQSLFGKSDPTANILPLAQNAPGSNIDFTNTSNRGR